MVRSFVWRDVSGTVGGGRSDGRWTVVSSDTHNNMHEKCPNESRVIWTFFFFFLSYGHHPIAPTGHKMHLRLDPMYVSYFVSIFYFTNYYIHID